MPEADNITASPPDTSSADNSTPPSDSQLPPASSAPKPTPLPVFQLSLLSTSLYGVLFSQNVLFPFLPFMVASFFPSLPISELGYRAGYLGAAFPAGLAVSSYYWGRLADRFGRKPCLVFGLVTTSLTIAAFGFSPSFLCAVALRFLSGALNGNNGIVKTMVSEACDDSNTARGFSIIGLLGGLARLTSPAVGGWLALPADKYDWADGVEWLQRWPFALPCLVSGGIAAVSAVTVWMWLRETLVRGENLLQVGAEDAEEDEQVDGRVGRWRRSIWRVRKALMGRRKGYDRVAEEDSRSDQQTAATTATIPTTSSGSSSLSSSQQPLTSPSIHSLLSSPPIAISVYLNALMACLAITQTEVIPLWLVVDSAHGGFSMSSASIASLLVTLGPFQMAHQLLLYPILTQRFGPTRLFRYALTIVAIACAIMPYNSYLQLTSAGPWLSWTAVVMTFIVMILARVTCFTCCFVLLNNSCPAHVKASANGLAQSLASIAQIVGPVVGGSVFAWSSGVGVWPLDFSLVWTGMAALCVVGVVLAGRLPATIDTKRKDGAAEGADGGGEERRQTETKKKEKERQKVDIMLLLRSDAGDDADSEVGELDMEDDVLSGDDEMVVTYTSSRRGSMELVAISSTAATGATAPLVRVPL